MPTLCVFGAALDAFYRLDVPKSGLYVKTSASGAAFPKQLPERLDDLDSVVANDWQSFKGLDVISSHWDRPHRTSLHWMVTFEQSPHVGRLAQACRDRLSLDGYDVISDDALHLTVRRMAYADEVSAQEVATLFGQTKDRFSDFSAFDLTLIPLAGSPGAIRLSVFPWLPLFDIYDTVATSSQNPTLATDSYRPHVGIAYSNSARPAGPVIRQVDALRASASVEVSVTEVSLVKLWRENRAYRWTTIDTLKLEF